STGTEQGLLYKGTGSEIPAAQTQSSFRVTVTAQNQVKLDVTNGDGTTGSYTGQALEAGQFYQVLITKHTKTPMGKDDGDSDPYSPPFDPGTMQAPQGPSSVNVDNG